MTVTITINFYDNDELNDLEFSGRDLNDILRQVHDKYQGISSLVIVISY